MSFYGARMNYVKTQSFKQKLGSGQSTYKSYRELPPPTTINAVKSFSSHVGFYIRIIKIFSKIANLLRNLFENDTIFKFHEAYIQAFEELKAKLTSAPIVATPDWSLPFEFLCDVSEYAIGVVLG